MSIDPWAAQELARTGVMPDYYVPLTLWTQALFVIYTLLAYCALVAYGGAMLSTRVLPMVMGILLLRRAQVPSTQDGLQRSASA